MVYLPLHMQKPFFLLNFLFTLYFTLPAQTNYPKNDFRSPVDTTMSLAGNFGEIRPNHFHAGFDIRTNNREGMPIYAAADGYVSRIKVSAVGYGKALYIAHPNGYTTVYGHLLNFDNDIQTLANKIQYLKESFEIDTILSPVVLTVKKGELIGLSGNTGGSQGPHLHFEIRDSNSEMPINPYYFGYLIADTVKPMISQIVIYPLTESASINGKNSPKKISPIYKKGNYSFLKSDTITANGTLGFAIECYDTETKSTNKNSVFSIELQSGGKRIYYQEFEKFTFENARYVNAHIDYESKQKYGSKIQKCFVTKNNQSGIFKDVIDRGAIQFNDDSIHWIRFILKDYIGNTTELTLKVKGRSKPIFSKISKEIKKDAADHKMMDCLKENKFNTADLRITIPAAAMYDDVIFNYSKKGKMPGNYSPLHELMDDETPLQKYISIGLKAIELPDSLQSKSCIVSYNKKGRKNYEGGTFSEGWLSTQTKTFGRFSVSIDTIAPKIKVISKQIKDKTTDYSKSKTIEILASDNLSGIRKYRATIDGKWVLCEYEFKKNLLFYTFDQSISKGEHLFQIEVSDDRQNTSTLSFVFIR